MIEPEKVPSAEVPELVVADLGAYCRGVWPANVESDTRYVKNDLIAGLTTGLVQIPDAMASAILTAVKPFNGLNTLVIGTPIGALFAGSVFMTVTTTGAIALALGDAVGKTGADERTGVLIMLTLRVGLIQLAFGLFKLGWITK